MSLSRLSLLIFLVLQAADGAITYGAVQVWGPAAEGNPLLTLMIALVGVGPALLVAKGIACGGGLLLYTRGVHRVLAALTALYAFTAVIPWLRVLLIGT